MNEQSIDLKQLRVAAQTGIDQGVLSGIMNVRPEFVVDDTFKRLVMQLNGYVLSEQAGPVEEGYAFERHRVPAFPRWIPKWLQRRWSREWSKEVTWRVTPTYIYPHANVPLPALGEPVRIVVTDLDRDGDE